MCRKNVWGLYQNRAFHYQSNKCSENGFFTFTSVFPFTYCFYSLILRCCFVPFTITTYSTYFISLETLLLKVIFSFLFSLLFIVSSSCSLIGYLKYHLVAEEPEDYPYASSFFYSSASNLTHIHIFIVHLMLRLVSLFVPANSRQFPFFSQP